MLLEDVTREADFSNRAVWISTFDGQLRKNPSFVKAVYTFRGFLDLRRVLISLANEQAAIRKGPSGKEDADPE